MLSKHCRGQGWRDGSAAKRTCLFLQRTRGEFPEPMAAYNPMSLQFLTPPLTSVGSCMLSAQTNTQQHTQDKIKIILKITETHNTLANVNSSSKPVCLTYKSKFSERYIVWDEGDTEIIWNLLIGNKKIRVESAKSKVTMHLLIFYHTVIAKSGCVWK